MFSNERDDLRQAYLTAWRKALSKQPLEPLERQIVEVVQQHPEYQPLLERGEEALSREWRPDGGETNPFLHMGLHIALHEQLSVDRPAGIRRLYQAMVEACLGDIHAAEHHMLECLAEELWKAQQQGREFRDKPYLKCIKRRGAGRRVSG